MQLKFKRDLDESMELPFKCAAVVDQRPPRTRKLPAKLQDAIVNEYHHLSSGWKLR